MKKFLINTTTIALTLVVLLFLGEFVVRSLPNSYKTKHEYMLQHASEVETIILGSSHTYYGIDPEYVDGNVFNLANMSQNYKYDDFLFSQYAENYESLKKVIIPVSYFSFFSKPFEESYSWTKIPNYILYMDCPYNRNVLKYKFEFTRWDVYKGKLVAYFKNSVRNCSALGWGMDYTLSEKRIHAEENEKRADMHTAKDWKYLSQNLGYLTKILDFCKDESIRVILVTTPTYHSYYENLDEKQLNKMYRLIDSLQNKYHLEYYNYLKDSRFVADDFFDSDHLSDVGATKFSKILNQDMKSVAK